MAEAAHSPGRHRAGTQLARGQLMGEQSARGEATSSSQLPLLCSPLPTPYRISSRFL